MGWKTYDIETDVLVVGYGAAGAAAAITASDNGANALILEKMPAGGGNSRVSGGNIMVPKSMEFAKYLNSLTFGTTEPKIIDTYVENAMKNADWIRAIGGDVTLFTPLRVGYPISSGKAAFGRIAGAEHMAKYNVKGTEAEGAPGQKLFGLLSRAVDARGIKVMTGTRARELVKSATGEITGVIAEREGKQISIKARKAVVMTCGGFEYDQDLKRDNLPVKLSYAHGNPGNTGDGIRMVQKVGAALWHMAALSCHIGFKAPEHEASFHIRFYSPAFLYVDKYARRFVDEASLEPHHIWMTFAFLDLHRAEFPRVPMYAIFSEETRKRGPLYIGSSGFNRDTYKWSPDNSQEIAKGWIKKAKSVAELASLLPVDASTLQETVTNYNEYCKAGSDPEFGRAKEHLRAIEGPPYYAIQLWPCLLNTQGGPRRDAEARVLDPDGKPIPRLYAAGEFGSIWGFLYPGAGNIGECLVFGRIAGKNAAGEKPAA